MDYTVHGTLQFRILEWVAVPFSRGILPTHGSNPGLLRCRQILYHLSYQGSPISQNKHLPFNCIIIIIWSVLTMAILKPFVTHRQVFFILYSSLNALIINYR